VRGRCGDWVEAREGWKTSPTRTRGRRVRRSAGLTGGPAIKEWKSLTLGKVFQDEIWARD
jgi:hypothetical protein